MSLLSIFFDAMTTDNNNRIQPRSKAEAWLWHSDLLKLITSLLVKRRLLRKYYGGKIQAVRFYEMSVNRSTEVSLSDSYFLLLQEALMESHELQSQVTTREEERRENDSKMERLLKRVFLFFHMCHHRLIIVSFLCRPVVDRMFQSTSVLFIHRLSV